MLLLSPITLQLTKLSFLQSTETSTPTSNQNNQCSQVTLGKQRLTQSHLHLLSTATVRIGKPVHQILIATSYLKLPWTRTPSYSESVMSSVHLDLHKWQKTSLRSLQQVLVWSDSSQLGSMLGHSLKNWPNCGNDG